MHVHVHAHSHVHVQALWCHADCGGYVHMHAWMCMYSHVHVQALEDALWCHADFGGEAHAAEPDAPALTSPHIPLRPLTSPYK